MFRLTDHPLSLMDLLQSHCVRGGQQHLPEGRQRCGWVSLLHPHRQHSGKKCPDTCGSLQQTRLLLNLTFSVLICDRQHLKWDAINTHAPNFVYFTKLALISQTECCTPVILYAKWIIQMYFNNTCMWIERFHVCFLFYYRYHYGKIS